MNPKKEAYLCVVGDGGGCWGFFFREISSEISKNKALVKDPAWCFLPSADAWCRFLYLHWQKSLYI